MGGPHRSIREENLAVRGKVNLRGARFVFVCVSRGRKIDRDASIFPLIERLASERVSPDRRIAGLRLDGDRCPGEKSRTVGMLLKC